MRANTQVTKILQLAREDPRLLEQLETFRRLITVMFTDIKGSTEYFENFGDIAGLAIVHECNDALRDAIETHGGRVIKTIGDAVMATFEDSNQSVRAAISIQRRLQEKNARRKKSDEMLVRIGLHHGLGIVKSDDVFGDVVNVASRVESIAQAEQIVVSDSLQQKILPSEFDLIPLGRFRLKGKSEDRHLYEVRWNKTEFVPDPVVHTTASRASVHNATVQQLASNGAVVAEYPLTAKGVTVGNAETDPNSQESSKLPLVEARFFLRHGQPTVEDVGKAGNIFIRLVGTYTLENGDIVGMGKRMFKFVCESEVVEAAGQIGKTISNISELLHEPPAQFVRVAADGSERKEKYPVRKEEITFGRMGATYSLDDDPFISRFHSRVYHRGENFFLEDLCSRNGTLVKVRDKTPVPFGASVLVGGQEFRVMQGTNGPASTSASFDGFGHS